MDGGRNVRIYVCRLNIKLIFMKVGSGPNGPGRERYVGRPIFDDIFGLM